MSIVVSNLVKSYGANRVVDDVSFEVGPGELVALLGPSGGGKSTLLRMIAGLEQADAGEVRLDGRRVDHLHPRDRGVGFVFQHYALFRHMTVAENVGFGLEVRGAPKAEIAGRVERLLGTVGLAGFGPRLPHQLSGGQRQRVALARALAPEPRLLLLDEPFGAVDAKVREELRRWLRRLHDEVHTTSVFVTHDQEEAFAVADRVMIVSGGRLEQAGSPAEVLDTPATEFVARFVGEVNVLDAVMRAGRAWIGATGISAAVDRSDHDNASPTTDGPVHLVVRAYDLKFWRRDDGPARVRRVLPLGDRVRVEAELVDGGQPLFAQFPRRSSLLTDVAPGVRIAVEVTRARAFPAR